ncbi:hypothetical protein [Bifidobacterium sp. UTBIF-56]|uniref:hypothetical protein n=2 Tax=Bifidobacterium TaxID=1678 RepID=UPI0011274A49|nr:hypothetical protein [Bifidobacterium sp. UTBIF-56]TPF78040.1 hypothetical protein BW09_06285 [Bifidobacterium sp. UTCIF-1]TPF80305.1 hypothetical protein BW08_05165 [Bifidobacterium sp. UTCIF-24]TPF81694.1 hypothetical protein BW12_08520 [Bifidobacterium sp. UTCIF-3]TPF84277.1 hypothetical protein BW07_05505 [Bifidobacterium sp. UTCIF-36]TPF89285.1 hypothetical protein BW10_06830 [Bifidobacterium sp. UTBIF-56]
MNAVAEHAVRESHSENRSGSRGGDHAEEPDGSRGGEEGRAARRVGNCAGNLAMRSAAFVSRWFRTHWFRVAMALFILAATLIEWAAIPPVYPLNFLFSGISVVGIVLSPFMPRTSGWMIIATVLGRLFVLDLSGPNPLWAAYLALAIIGYNSAIPVAIGALVTVSLAECVPVALNTFNAISATWVGMVNYIGMFTLATMAGMSFRWRKQRDEIRDHAMALERRQWQADTLRRNTRLASRIHDSASGGLSYIALTAQRQLRRTPDDPAHATERRDWEFVNTQALGVLDEIHHVIDLLEEVAPGQSAGPTGPPESVESARPDHTVGIATIMQAVGAGRERLARLGFHGTFEIRGELPDDCADESVREAANLIGELTANIGRHLDPATGGYYCVVTLGHDTIEIMETNPLRQLRDAEHGDGEARGRGENRAGVVAGVGSDTADEPDDRGGMAVSDGNVDFSAGIPSHGSGLMMHRRIIAGLGGVLNDSAEDGDWVLYARIPTRPAGDSLGRSDSGTASERNGALHPEGRALARSERDSGSPS